MANDCHYKIDSLCLKMIVIRLVYGNAIIIQWWMNVEMTNPYTDKRPGKIS